MPLRLGDPLPSLSGASEWLNSEGAPNIGASPLLVHFWSISCYLCKENLPKLRAWRAEYEDKGLQIVAVHMPRQPEDTDLEQVRKAVEDLRIAEPCAIDNEHSLKDAFKNEQGWVPAYFLFDANGALKSRAAGETGLNMTKNALDRLFVVATAVNS